MTRLTRAAYYKSRTNWAARDAAVIAASTAAVAECARRGFWKCYDRIHNQGHPWNHKHVYRVPDETQPAAAGEAPGATARAAAAVGGAGGEVWALDFMRDTLYGRKVFRTLNMIDEANRGGLGIDIATSIPVVRVVAFVAQLIDLHGRPRATRCDNGPELTSETFTTWCRSEDIELRFIQPGKPDLNGCIERFNQTYREEVLSVYLFDLLDQVRDITAELLEQYHEIGPDDALGSLPPARYRERLLAAETPV